MEMKPMEESYKEEEEVRPKRKTQKTGGWRQLRCVYSVRTDTIYLGKAQVSKNMPMSGSGDKQGEGCERGGGFSGTEVTMGGRESPRKTFDNSETKKSSAWRLPGRGGAIKRNSWPIVRADAFGEPSRTESSGGNPVLVN